MLGCLVAGIRTAWGRKSRTSKNKRKILSFPGVPLSFHSLESFAKPYCRPSGQDIDMRNSASVLKERASGRGSRVDCHS